MVSQLLLPTADGKGRVAVNEILLRTSGLPNLIREGNTPMIELADPVREERGHADDGRRAVRRWCRPSRIHPRDAYLKATDKARFEPLVKD